MQAIANMLVQIKNAQAVGAAEVVLPFSKLRLAVAEVLRANGFLQTIERKQKLFRKKTGEWLSLQLRYQAGEGVIHGVKLVSRSSRRSYATKRQLFPVKNGLGIVVVSTSRGVLTGQAARQAGVGGEVLFEIW